VHATVFDTNGVDSHLFWYELDAVLTGAEILYLAHFRHSRWARHRRFHVVTISTYRHRHSNLGKKTGDYFTDLTLVQRNSHLPINNGIKDGPNSTSK